MSCKHLSSFTALVHIVHTFKIHSAFVPTFKMALNVKFFLICLLAVEFAGIENSKIQQIKEVATKKIHSKEEWEEHIITIFKVLEDAVIDCGCSVLNSAGKG